MGSDHAFWPTLVGRSPRRALVFATVVSTTIATVASACSPDNVSGRSVTFATACTDAPSKTRFRADEDLVMKVELGGRVGTEGITEFISVQNGDSVQLIDKTHRDVSPSTVSYCKTLSPMLLDVKLDLAALTKGGLAASARKTKKAWVDFFIEVYTGAELRATGTVTIEWER